MSYEQTATVAHPLSIVARSIAAGSKLRWNCICLSYTYHSCLFIHSKSPSKYPAWTRARWALNSQKCFLWRIRCASSLARWRAPSSSCKWIALIPNIYIYHSYLFVYRKPPNKYLVWFERDQSDVSTVCPIVSLSWYFACCSILHCSAVSKLNRTSKSLHMCSLGYYPSVHFWISMLCPSCSANSPFYEARSEGWSTKLCWDLDLSVCSGCRLLHIYSAMIISPGIHVNTLL